MSVRVLWVMVVSCCSIEAKPGGRFNLIEGNSTNTGVNASPSLLLEHHEPQPLPIIPIGIIAYTVPLLRHNLCQNSCLWPGQLLMFRFNQVAFVLSNTICVSESAFKGIHLTFEN